ncbi:ribonuclease III domain-containing protein [Elsinoe australis]|uniref:Ribonuclease III domain-containing protein n=1 Tax=Elsinoe australis TaxID=40998 RepID=A0A4U7BC59_9PEZI|nr:ribonuclease III domain-containing protein [Elsinoe australis]
MKRQSEDGHGDPLKKQKVQSAQADSEHLGNGSIEKSSKQHTSGNPGTETANYTPQDPIDSLKALENSLASLATAPDLVTSLLGPDALDPMKRLLSLLQARQNATSLNALFPAPFPTIIQTPLPPPQLSPFTPNNIYPFTLPPLPPIHPGPYTDAPFIHRSATPTDRVTGASLLPNGLPTSSSSSGPHPHQIQETNYERLEFLGDAYLELFATTLIFSRFPHLTSGRQSQLRESLVNNETLMRFSRAYGFDNRLQAQGFEGQAFGKERAARGNTLKGNKGLNKVLADVFEAYVAAVVLSDEHRGYERAQGWCWGLWTPVLVEQLGDGKGARGGVEVVGDWWVGGRESEAGKGGRGRSRSRSRSVERMAEVARGRESIRSRERRGSPASLVRRTLSNERNADSGRAYALAKGGEKRDRDAAVLGRKAERRTDPKQAQGKADLQVLAEMRRNQVATNPYNAGAKAELQKRIAPGHIRLVYRDYQKGKQLKKTTIFYHEVVLTGWGYENKVLGRGEGESKVEAGNRAATDAMKKSKLIVEECERRWNDEKIRKQREREQAGKQS